MKVVKKELSPTHVQLAITADKAELEAAKNVVLSKLAKDVKIAGFRAGKAPLNLVEKNVDQGLLQTEFLDEIFNKLYIDAVVEGKLRPVEQPKVDIKKFVPFTNLEVTAEVEVVSDIKLADYKKIKIEKPKVSVTAKEINDVIEKLRQREATRREVKRPAKNGDEVTIDFNGVDANTKEVVNGADGKDYPLVLGSNTFIPGFEPELIGLKVGEIKTFTITFPSDYGVAALQNRKVTFGVKASKIQELKEPALDDKFVAKVGPFKTVAELKADIKKTVTAERERDAQNAFENDLLTKIADKSEVEVPEALVEEQIDAMENDERQNLVYRGQTWEEHLKEEGLNDKQHRERQRPVAQQRVKIGLILSEISTREKIDVTPEELEIRMQLLKGQYTDKQMQDELDKPENRRDIANRLMAEKTIAKLASYSQK